MSESNMVMEEESNGCSKEKEEMKDNKGQQKSFGVSFRQDLGFSVMYILF